MFGEQTFAQLRTGFKRNFILKEFVLIGFDCICKYSGVSLCLEQNFILKEFVLRGFDWICLNL